MGEREQYLRAARLPRQGPGDGSSSSRARFRSRACACGSMAALPSGGLRVSRGRTTVLDTVVLAREARIESGRATDQWAGQSSRKRRTLGRGAHARRLITKVKVVRRRALGDNPHFRRAEPLKLPSGCTRTSAAPPATPRTGKEPPQSAAELLPISANPLRVMLTTTSNKSSRKKLRLRLSRLGILALLSRATPSPPLA